MYLCPEGDEEETPNSKRESKSTCERVSDITPKPSASKSRNQLKRIHKEQHYFLLVAAEWLETVRKENEIQVRQKKIKKKEEEKPIDQNKPGTSPASHSIHLSVQRLYNKDR